MRPRLFCRCAKASQRLLLPLAIGAPAEEYGIVLFAIHRIGGRHPGGAETCALSPYQAPGPGIEGAEVAVARAGAPELAINRRRFIAFGEGLDAVGTHNG